MDVSSVKWPSERSDDLIDLDLQEFDTGCPDEIRSELQRILSSRQFDASERNRRFLEYVVEETLSGRGERIKAYNVATLVFGRDENFDPQLDPVVRMEARRLRRSLERFYLVNAQTDGLHIVMPKGGYVPKFHRPHSVASEAAEANGGLAPSRFRGPSVRVIPFEVEDVGPNRASYADGFARQIAVSLSRFPEFSVFLSERIESGTARDQQHDAPDADLILGGDTALTAESLKVKATLLDRRTGRLVWGEAYERDWRAEGLLNTRDVIAERIARVVADPGGIVSGAGAVATAGGKPTSYGALLAFYRYRRSLHPDLFKIAWQQQEQAAASDPDQSEAMACHSLLCSDGHRFGFMPIDGPSHPRERAMDLARRAVDLAPTSSRAHHALGIACWLSGDADGGLEALRKAYASNPNDMEAMADLGFHLCLRGEWTKGVTLIEAALAEVPVLAGLPRLGLSLFHLHNNNFAQALVEVRQIRTDRVAAVFAVRAMALRELGRAEEMAAAVERVTDIDRHYWCHPLEELGVPCLDGALTLTIRAALAQLRPGRPVPDPWDEMRLDAGACTFGSA